MLARLGHAELVARGQAVDADGLAGLDGVLVAGLELEGIAHGVARGVEDLRVVPLGVVDAASEQAVRGKPKRVLEGEVGAVGVCRRRRHARIRRHLLRNLESRDALVCVLDAPWRR